MTEDRRTLPLPVGRFGGKIAPSAAASTPSFPERINAPTEAPNVVLIMTDDVGFGVASTFGGPVPTPNLDRLAAKGLVYNRFHTTALCSPSRAALLTGRNQHAVGTGVVTDLATGYPGYTSIIPKSAATIAEVLRQNGYSTSMFGKHHNVPMWEETAAGPFDHWPTGLGFEYFYGFIGGATNQWHPNLVRGTSRVVVSDTGSGDAVLDRFLADDAINWLHEQKAAAPDKPFFMYYAPGTAHSPHQAPKEWIERFTGEFDQGWDVLHAETVARQKTEKLIPASTEVTSRPEGIPAWADLSSERKQVAARMMEVYAGMIAFQDAQIGRVLDEISRMGLEDNTLVIFIEGDNGTSPEGGIEGSTNSGATIVDRGSEDGSWRYSQLDVLGSEKTLGHFPVGWTWALNSPLPWMKGVASHLGGTRNGLVVSWPAGIRQRGVRTQFHYITDIMPTILEAARVPAPDMVNGVPQQRMDGISFAYSFKSAKVPERRHTQYFELMGNRALYHDGWLAATTPQRLPWQSTVPPGDLTKWPWELYNLEQDFAQAKNLADRYPQKLESLKLLWEKQARANSVYPLDDSTLSRLRHNPYKAARNSYTYWGPVRIPDASAPPLRDRSFTLIADVEIPANGGEGVLAASGGHFGGWGFYLKDGRPIAVHRASQQKRDYFEVKTTSPLSPGRMKITYTFAIDAGAGAKRGGELAIRVDGVELAKGRIDRLASFDEAQEPFEIGDDSGTQVSDDYGANVRFNGIIKNVTVDVQR
ncbi:arylsulfatase [Caenibius tardaugens]|nr:arylsulfatase [Caenibius tardaugens]